ncbi:MAG: DNA primase [Candidatus Omnitrophota bacterium]
MPRLSQETLDEILSRIDITEVISSYIPLKKIGRSFKAICPFHNEKTASFIVSQEKQIYHCFGCGAGGNAFNFLMQYERIGFQESVEILAKKAQVSLPQREEYKETSLVTKLYKVIESAVVHYHNLLLKSDNALRARDYLKKRNINQDTINKFKLGFAEDSWQGLIDFLRSKDIPISLIEKCGLIVPRQNGGYYDRFRNRIVCPIFDLKSRPVAFSARVLPTSNPVVAKDAILPKYINSPDTPIFSKGKLLYGLNLAKDNIREYGYLIIVEGNFDFISLYQAGLFNTVATLGTALTNDHARLIKRFTNNVKVLFDADKAGELAALRAFDIFIEEGINLEIVALDKGFDPDSYIHQYGIQKLKELLNRSNSFFDYKLKLLTARFDINSSNGKAEVVKEILLTIKKIDNEVLKTDYLKKVSELLRIDEQAVFDEFKKFKNTPSGDFNKGNSIFEFRNNVLSAEMTLLKLALKESDFLYRLKENINPYEFSDPRIADIISEIFNLLNNNQEISISRLISQFQDSEHINILSQASLSGELDFTSTGKDSSSLNRLLDDCIRRIKDQNLKLKRKNIQEQIMVAQRKNDQDRLKELLVEFKNCLK